MTDFDRDADLRRRFARLRHEESVPDYAHTIAAARHRRKEETPERWWLYPALAAPLAAVALAVWLLWSPGGPQGTPPTSIALRSAAEGSLGSWETPTDELLEMPGADLLSGVPAMGESDLDSGFLDDLDLGGGANSGQPSASARTRRYV
jgi:hypothetical protein